MLSEAEITDRLNHVRAIMAASAVRSGRRPEAVKLVLASKTQPPSAIAAAYNAGARDFGENYVQEALAKRDELESRRDIRWHLIGHLQSNKARAAAEAFELIHTLDGEHLAITLGRIHPAPPLPVLLQINLGGETSKAGIRAGDAERLITNVRKIVAVKGLMTIPRPSPEPEASRRSFAALRELRDRLAAATGLSLQELSMGMTDDYPIAIAEGATIVRIGRAVFGPRPSAR
jgi:pyridoxal phosphate enzyme (YggS family)